MFSPHWVGKGKIGMWTGEIRGKGCDKGGYEKEGKAMSIRGGGEGIPTSLQPFIVVTKYLDLKY